MTLKGLVEAGKVDPVIVQAMQTEYLGLLGKWGGLAAESVPYFVNANDGRLEAVGAIAGVFSLPVEWVQEYAELGAKASDLEATISHRILIREQVWKKV